MMTRWIVCAGVFLAAGAAALAEDSGVRAMTRPSADVTLSFTQPGRVAEILFKEGATVQAGQLIARLDDALEQAQLAQILAKSKDTTQIRAAEASLAQKEVDLRKLEKAAERRAATALEVEHARLNVKIAELSLELAKFEHSQAGLQVAEAKVRVENMRLKSPLAGVVEQVQVEMGESVNGLQEVMRIVQIDPLWIDAMVPTAAATPLKPSDRVDVMFTGQNEASAQGRIVHVSAVADAASETLRVRIQVPNPARRPAGEHVRVILPSSATAVSGGQVP